MYDAWPINDNLKKKKKKKMLKLDFCYQEHNDYRGKMFVLISIVHCFKP